MIYLATGLVLWLIRAALPTVVVLLAGAVAAWIAHRLSGLSLRAGFLGAAVLASVVLVWQTRSVRREFTHPEITMFRRYIANPIPPAVRNLSPGSPAPLVFSNGAVVSFEAPDSILRGLLDHTLRGSMATEFLADLKSRNGRDATTRDRVGAPTGDAYMRVDSASFPQEMRDVFPGAHRRVLEAARQGLEVYVLAEAGEWGRFESVVTYDRAPQRVHVRQYVVRAPVDLD